MIQQYAQHVYKILGPGYSERVYHNAMEVVLRKNGIHYETERIVLCLRDHDIIHGFNRFQFDHGFVI